MADKTKIQWTDATLNALVGCSRESAGCMNCFAEKLSATRLKHQSKYTGLAVVNEQGEARWTRSVRIHQESLDQMIRWRRPRRIFLTSMGDPFHEGYTDEQIVQWMAACAAAPQHSIQVLTKRAQRMHQFFRDVPATRVAKAAKALLCARFAKNMSPQKWNEECARLASATWNQWPLPNLWLGVSVEDQKTVNERSDWLLNTPATVRFLSCEPLLEPVFLRLSLGCHASKDGECDHWAHCPQRRDGEPAKSHRSCPLWNAEDEDEIALSPQQQQREAERPRIHWAIVGGESGHGARPCELGWIRSIIKQCRLAQVPCFVKQLGADPIDERMVDIVGPSGKVHERRPVGHPDVADAQQRIADGRAPAYTTRPSRLRMLLRDSHGANPGEWPEDLQVRQFPVTKPPRDLSR